VKRNKQFQDKGATTTTTATGKGNERQENNDIWSILTPFALRNAGH
jgi:hypothetical protein